MAQTWHDLLFAHWPLPVAALQALLPQGLAVDTFDGEAWVGVVPFRMSGIRLRATPALPWVSAFPELNLRTYVTRAGKPGVWFFSLDAANPLAVAVARRWFHLPYFRARMRCASSGADAIEYASVRRHAGAPAAELVARYRPCAPVERARPGSLEHWLTERYRLYAADRRGALFEGEIHHAPWPLQRAEWELERDTLSATLGIEIPERAPLLHFARRLDVAIWAPKRVV
jgi:hypothetical protein